jgi:hypothetical protein
MTRSLHHALEETLGVIQRALDRVRVGENAQAELHNVRAYLLNMPGIESASDDLYAMAKELAGGADQGSRISRLLQEAFIRLGDRLALARPSEQARGMGIS